MSENKSNLRQQFLYDMMKAGAAEVGLSTVDILDDWGFFDMPASTKYHGTNEGDLFRHSKAVANELERITKACDVKWQNPRSPILIGYFHDLCKCDSYQIDNSVPYTVGEPTRWKYRENQVLSGHGDKSVMLASTLCQLTEEEMLCIRYHMGAYETNDWKGFDRAIKKYQTVLWTHQADMLASKVVQI